MASKTILARYKKLIKEKYASTQGDFEYNQKGNLINLKTQDLATPAEKILSNDETSKFLKTSYLKKDYNPESLEDTKSILFNNLQTLSTDVDYKAVTTDSGTSATFTIKPDNNGLEFFKNVCGSVLLSLINNQTEFMGDTNKFRDYLEDTIKLLKTEIEDRGYSNILYFVKKFVPTADNTLIDEAITIISNFSTKLVISFSKLIIDYFKACNEIKDYKKNKDEVISLKMARKLIDSLHVPNIYQDTIAQSKK